MTNKLNSLQDLFIDELQDLYSAEKQLVSALPKMAKNANNEQLKNAFEQHLNETKEHVNRLDQVFESIGEKAKAKTCKAMQGLVEEAQEMMKEDGDPNVMDAALIASAQRVEHYEIAGYGCVRTYARMLGYKQAETLLNQTLQEEAKTDEKLTKLAESSINVQAKQGQTAGTR